VTTYHLVEGRKWTRAEQLVVLPYYGKCNVPISLDEKRFTIGGFMGNELVGFYQLVQHHRNCVRCVYLFQTSIQRMSEVTECFLRLRVEATVEGLELLYQIYLI